MSANIYWEAVDPNPKSLHVMAPSWFMGCLERAGMDLPHTFDSNDISVLRGLAASMNEDKNPFNQLIEAIEENGSVNVWYEY
jgi:hypothetical protein